MSITIAGHEFTEIEERIGEGTEFAATIKAVPQFDGDELEWRGSLLFDDNRFNLRTDIDSANGQVYTHYHQWWFPHLKSGGTHLMNLLVIYHEQFVNMFKNLMGKGVEK